MSDIFHGSAISIDGNAVLFQGASGSGKSDLALRLMDRGATLIGDDIIHIHDADGLPIISFAPNIAGKIEVRGIGICAVDFIEAAPLRLVVEFAHDVDRMPSDDRRTAIAGFSVPLVTLDPFHASSALKVELALRSVIAADLLPTAERTAAAVGSAGI